jgi:hypothetical protein
METPMNENEIQIRSHELSLLGDHLTRHGLTDPVIRKYIDDRGKALRYVAPAEKRAFVRREGPVPADKMFKPYPLAGGPRGGSPTPISGTGAKPFTPYPVAPAAQQPGKSAR